MTQSNEIKENIKIFLDNKAYLVKKFSKTNSLSAVREELTSKNKVNFVFAMKEGFQIEKEEEDEFTLFDILDENNLYLKSKNNDKNNEIIIDKPQENNKIDINKDNINNDITIKKNTEIQNSIKGPQNKNDIENIPPAVTPAKINNYEIKNNINKEIENTNINKDYSKYINPTEKIETINPLEMKNELIKIKVYINGVYQLDYEFNKNLNLVKAREKLFNLITNDFLFLLPDGFVIKHEEEEIFSIEGILDVDKIYIIQEKIILKMDPKANKNNNPGSFYKKKINPLNNLNINSTNSEIKLKQNDKLKDNLDYNNNNCNRNEYENSMLTYLKSMSRKLDNIGNLEIYLYPYFEFSPMEKKNSINFMVVGQTGSGKTTLLNAFLNYLLGIKFEDDFRFKLIHEDFGISKAESQTRDVILYNIKPFNDKIPPITVIDTPGFGDTGGLAKDKLISEKIAEKFQQEVDHINAICFVAQSTNSKLTINQKYIFNSIMDLFSDDIKENFIAMLTFCNIIDENPVILEPLKKKGSGFDLVLPAIEKTQWYFLFDNLAIFKSKENQKLNKKIKSFYGFAMENFDEFMNKLLSLPKKKLTNTKRVLYDRKYLEAKIEILEEVVRNCLSKIDEFIQTYNYVNKCYDELKNKNFIYTVKETHSKKVPTSTYTGGGGGFFTTCNICSHSCHKGCWIQSNAEKNRCSAMDTSGYCMSCPRKCRWEDHQNKDFIWEEYEEEVTKTDEFLKAKYVKKKSEKSAKEQILDGLEKDISNMNIELMNTQEEMKNTIY